MHKLFFLRGGHETSSSAFDCFCLNLSAIFGQESGPIYVIFCTFVGSVLAYFVVLISVLIFIKLILGILF